jgi:hypothetical protein
MPAKKGAANRAKRKVDGGFTPTATPTTNTPQWTGTDENRARPNLPTEFGIAPLILEVESLTKVKLSHLIKNNLPGVQVTNIYANKTNSFTIYAKDVKSFNRILNDLTTVIHASENRISTIYIPRSIQRILENNKEAFVKRVDLEITQEDIKNALQEQGLKHENIYRLLNKDKLPTKTVKITFTDPSNRDLFVKYGLQIDSMHFAAESANHNNKPSQCFRCFKFGHIAKYCKAEKQLCPKCGGDDHKEENCTNTKPSCSNCRGEHAATSSECQRYKEHQQRIEKTINKYSTTTKKVKPPQQSTDWHSKEDFPILPSPSKREQPLVIETLTETITKIVEKATEKILKTMNQRLELLASRLSKKFNIEIEELLVEDESQEYRPIRNTQTDQEEVDTTSTPTNGIKRKYISPNTSSENQSNTTTQ